MKHKGAHRRLVDINARECDQPIIQAKAAGVSVPAIAAIIESGSGR
jgi:hypothetical protein